MRSSSGLSAALLALALVAAACGGSDDASTTTDPVSTDAQTTTTQRQVSETTTTQLLNVEAESDDGEITIEVTASESAIWLATDATKICSPAEPAVSVSSWL